jgi:hypothetical protein
MAINPFQQFNSPSMSLLNVGGFQDPLQPKPIGQDIVNVPQLQNQVGQLQARKNQQLGSMLLALGDIFRGQDPSTGVMQRQMFLQEQEEERKARLEKQKLQQAYDSALASANPEQKKLIELLGPDGYKEYATQVALKNAGLSDPKKTADILNYEFFMGLTPEKQEIFKMLEFGSPDVAFALAEMKRKGASPAGLDLSPLELARDQKLAAELVEFERGGFAQVESNLDKLDKVIGQLESTQNLTGPVIGNVPTVLKAFTNPQAVGVEDDIRSIIFQSLRETLGAQFTEREGDRLVAASFNPLLSEEINAERLKRLRKETARSAQAKLDMIKYFDKKKTLRGYTGEVFDSSNILGNIIQPQDYAELTESEIEQIYLNPETTPQELEAIEQLLKEREGK